VGDGVKQDLSWQDAEKLKPTNGDDDDDDCNTNVAARGGGGGGGGLKECSDIK
jgi:hypothetical protein